MNKILSTILTTGCVAALALAVVSCNNNPATSGSTTATDSTNAISETELKIAYVNTDTLLEKYEYFKEIRTTLEAKAKKAQADLQARSLAFQREITEYEGKAATMSAAERQTTEERLARKQNELGMHQQNASTALAQDEADHNQKLYGKITDYLKTHANEKGYKFVLSYSALNPNLLFADEKLDITEEVLTALNDAYLKENPKK